MEHCSKDPESRRTTVARSLDFQVDSDTSSSEVSNADSRGLSTPYVLVNQRIHSFMNDTQNCVY